VVVGLLAVAALRRPAGRALVAVVVTQTLVLAAAPSWFSFYADFLTPALALVVAVGADVVGTSTPVAVLALRRRGAVRVVRRAGATAGLILLALPLIWLRVGRAFPQGSLAAAASTSSCVMADSPMALIELDALSRSFGARCRNWVDVTGRTYGADSSNRARTTNARWQRDVRNYLLSGDAFIVIRSGTGLSAATRAELERQPVLARDGQYVIYRGRKSRR
jgi:alpha-1,2-mannosyltransferase